MTRALSEKNVTFAYIQLLLLRKAFHYVHVVDKCYTPFYAYGLLNELPDIRIPLFAYLFRAFRVRELVQLKCVCKVWKENVT